MSENINEIVRVTDHVEDLFEFVCWVNYCVHFGTIEYICNKVDRVTLKQEFKKIDSIKRYWFFDDFQNLFGGILRFNLRTLSFTRLFCYLLLRNGYT